MTEKQVKDFISLNEKFIDRCCKVCQLLRPLDDNFGYLDTFEPDGDFVYSEGDEYWSYGGHEHLVFQGTQLESITQKMILNGN